MRYVINFARWATCLSVAVCVGWMSFALVNPVVFDVGTWPSIIRWSAHYGLPAWMVTSPLLVFADRNRIALRNRPGTAFFAGAFVGAALLAASEALRLGFTQGGLPVWLYAPCAMVGGVALLLYYSRFGAQSG